MQRSLYIVDVCAHPNFREGVERKDGIYVESLARRIGTLMGGAEAGGLWSIFLNRRVEAATAAIHMFLFVMAGTSSTSRVAVFTRSLRWH
jgi:hypothetical protein